MRTLTRETRDALTPQMAIDVLRRGNERFVKGTRRMVRAQAGSLAVTAMLANGGIGIALGALASLLDFILTKTPSSLGKAVFGSVMCVTAFLLTFHVLSWRDVFSWLPALPLGAGLGMVTTHAASQSSSHRLLIRGAVFAALGIAGWLPQFPQLREMLPSMQTVWAVLLIAIGGIILYQQLKD